MPEIPSITANEPLRTGNTSVEASPQDFGPNPGVLAHGMLAASEGLSRLGGDLAIANKHKKLLDDAKWVNDSLFQEKNYHSEWMAQQENNTAEDYAAKYLEMAKDRIETNVKAAPNGQAAAQLKMHLQNMVSSNYNAALKTTEETRLTGAIQSIDQYLSNSLGTYRNNLNIPNVDPAPQLYQDREHILEFINTYFGDTSPKTAAKLREHVDVQFTLGAMRDHPGLSKLLIGTSPNLSEETRATLQNKFDAEQKAGNRLTMDSFERERENYVDSVMQGKNTAKLPIERYEGVYPGDMAQIKKREDDEKIDTYNRANSTFDEWKGLNAATQSARFSKLVKSANGTEDKNVIHLLGLKLRDELKQQDENPVAWLTENNLEVQQTRQGLDVAVDPQQAKVERQRYVDTLLKYQGYAPKDDPHPEQYLNKPTNDRHVLTQAEFDEQVNTINRGSPKEAIAKIRQVVDKFSDPVHQMMAFNDLVSMNGPNKGLRQEYQILWQNKDFWWADHLASIFSNGEAISKLDDTKKQDMLKVVDLNPTWRQFSEALIGGDFERAKEIEGFKNGVMIYAQALTSSGKTMKQATDQAIQMVIGSTLGFTRVNGRSLAIPRDYTPGKRADDAEVQDLGRRLGVALRDIDVREIDQTPFTALTPLGNEQRVERLQALQDIVTSQGFYMMENNGQAVSLWVPGDHGIPIQVRDKKNEPLVIYFDEVPDFKSVQTYPSIEGAPIAGQPPNVVPRTGIFPEVPQKTYNLQETTGSLFGLGEALGTKRTKTNWRIRPPYIKSQ
jgi:hypothetical protein